MLFSRSAQSFSFLNWIRGVGRVLTGNVGVASLAGFLLLGGQLLNAPRGQAEAQELSPAQTVSVPVEDSQIAAALERLDGMSLGSLKRSGVPGLAVAVTWKGKTVFAKGYGVRASGKPDRVNADTVFQIASVSKSLAATVVAGHVDARKIRWDDLVVSYLPDFRLQNEAVTDMVTLGDLFAHRSGLPDHAGDDLEDLGFNRAEVLARLHLLPLGGFRTDYAYTNFGLTAAAEAVAVASGTDWATLSENILYTPLAMDRTSSRFSDFMARDNKALPHVRDNGQFESLYQRQPDAQSPAGGVSSSVTDLAKWIALVLGEGSCNGKSVIDAQMLLEATTAEVISGPSRSLDARPSLYGYGFNVGVEPSGRVTLSHSGAFALGAATSFLMVPSLDLGIIVLTNGEPFGVPESLARSFIDVVEYGEPRRDWLAGYQRLLKPLMQPVGMMAGKPVPVAALPAAPLTDYAGTYSNSYFGPAAVLSDGNEVTLEIGPAGLKYDLKHWDGDTFFFEPRLENAPAGSRSLVRFERGPTVGFGSLWIEYLDEYGLGTFERN
ncbi:serine hydrolase [Roseibium algae]|uniref:Serine hydrolase n=1 Tax=Roseibium algae TaxID=3123038 RepID=A0ABU8TT29_9HYPH